MKHFLRFLPAAAMSMVLLFSVSCKDDDTDQPVADLPVVTTSSVSNVALNTASCGGNVTSDGGAAVTERGVCWGTAQHPTISNSKLASGSGTGSFSSNLTGLAPNTTYYIRAYATNSAGTAYGSEGAFKTYTGTMTDYDGNVYYTITIGTQVWMAKNLNVSHYRNGDAIPNVTGDTQWAGLTTGAYCDFDNLTSNSTTYGKLYNWHAVNDSRKLAPAGWHVPSTAEWTTLVNYLGGQSAAGGKLKETGTSHWQSPNTAASNASLFTALPGGSRSYLGVFDYLGRTGCWWGSTGNGGIAGDIYLFDNSGDASIGADLKEAGFSVRCIKD